MGYVFMPTWGSIKIPTVVSELLRLRNSSLSYMIKLYSNLERFWPQNKYVRENL